MTALLSRLLSCVPLLWLLFALSAPQITWGYDAQPSPVSTGYDQRPVSTSNYDSARVPTGNERNEQRSARCAVFGQFAELLAAKSGTALARELGAAGEQAAGIIKNTERIPSLTGTAKYRIPDVLNRAEGVIGEVKNVGSLSYGNQLKDYLAYAQQNGLQFELTVRPGTQLSGPLQEAVGRGEIFLKYLP